MSPERRGTSNVSPTATVLDVVARRADVLRYLVEQPQRKRDLVERLDVSRSTIDRAIRDLETYSFVDRTERGYTTTLAGTLALDSYRECVDALAAITDVRSILTPVPASAPMSATMLEGATIHESNRCAPNAPFDVVTDLVEAAERVRAALAADRTTRFNRLIHRQTVEGDLDAEFVVTDDLADFLFETYPGALAAIMTDGGTDVFAVSGLPYDVGVADLPDRRCAFLVVPGENTEIRGVVENDDPDAVEWAHEIYRRYRDAGRRLDPPSDRAGGDECSLE